MRITLIGSSSAMVKKVALKKELIGLGHEPIIHPHYEDFVAGKRQDILDLVGSGEHAQAKIDNDYIMWYYNAIVGSEAVLVTNLNKEGRENYIGGNTFLEIGFAYVNGKKIFVYNDLPQSDVCGFLDEIIAMQPIVINGDLSKIQ